MYIISHMITASLIVYRGISIHDMTSHHAQTAVHLSRMSVQDLLTYMMSTLRDTCGVFIPFSAQKAHSCVYSYCSSLCVLFPMTCTGGEEYRHQSIGCSGQPEYLAVIDLRDKGLHISAGGYIARFVPTRCSH